MGETSNKMNKDEAHKRVVQLRDEIARKRDVIGVELDELRRRREGFMTKTESGLKLAGIGLVGLLIGGSLIRGVGEFLMSDPEEEAPAAPAPSVIAQGTTIASLLTGGVGALILGELRTFALEYARKRITEKLEENKRK